MEAPIPVKPLKSRSILEDFAGVVIESNRNPIFNPRGTASSFGTIKVSNASGEKEIKIGITGRVRVTTP